MSEHLPETPHVRRHHFLVDTLVLGGLLLIGLFGSQLVGVSLVLYRLNWDMAALQNMLADPESMGDAGRVMLLTLQGIATVGTFILPPVLLLWRFHKQSLASFSPRPRIDAVQVLIAILLIPACAPLLELIITWNKNILLPEYLRGIEEWAQAKEAQLGELTEFLIAFSSPQQFMLGLLVIAVLPAIGEELLFRGTLQPMLGRAVGNPHLAIWLTAFVFSAIHVQFYGFVPRLLLGALFGYLYYWSGNILIPMLAHFVNNGVTVVLSYLSQQGNTALDPENLPEPPLYVLILSVILAAGLLYRFYQQFTLHPKPTQL